MQPHGVSGTKINSTPDLDWPTQDSGLGLLGGLLAINYRPIGHRYEVSSSRGPPRTARRTTDRGETGFNDVTALVAVVTVPGRLSPRGLLSCLSPYMEHHALSAKPPMSQR